MEEGSLRCDANVSVRPAGESKLGTKAELKNMNSFKHVEAAIEYEIARQSSLLERGERVIQETRLWNADKGTSHAMRSKESAHDYRYFPEPDLPPLQISDAWLGSIQLPELPLERRQRFLGLGLTPYDADVLTADQRWADFLDGTVQAGADPKQACNWISSELLQHESVPISPPQLAELIDLIVKGTISGKIAKDVLHKMLAGQGTASEIVAREGLTQLTDAAAIEPICKKIVDENPKQAAGYRGGNPKLLGFFVGQVMKATQGKANPELVNDILKKLLK
jgi:aspartyl-tRNA(Asn)/glutamyl-tRNA(Gln) amidotransferase subunit B